jgi:hypothetical protein
MSGNDAGAVAALRFAVIADDVAGVGTGEYLGVHEHGCDLDKAVFTGRHGGSSKKQKSEVKRQPREEIRTPKDPIFDALETPSGSTVGNIKTIGDGSKVFFHGDQFSLAFGEKKSILRNKKSALELLVSCRELSR